VPLGVHPWFFLPASAAGDGCYAGTSPDFADRTDVLLVCPSVVSV